MPLKSKGAARAASTPKAAGIPVLKQGCVVAFAQVSQCDFDLLSQRRWRLGKKGYAVTGKNGHTMGRIVLGLATGDPRQCDHKNRNKLDNRRSNLRIVSNEINKQNCGSYQGGTSNYRGVSWDKKAQRWRAQAKVAKKQFHLGHFDSELEAANAAQQFRLKHMPGALD